MASSINNEYVRMLLAARKRNHALNRQQLIVLSKSLQDGIKRILRDVASGTIDKASAEFLKQQFAGLIKEFTALTVDKTTANVALTVRDLQALHLKLTSELLKKYRPDKAAVLLERFRSANVRSLAAIASRTKNAATFRTLMRRNMTPAAPALDRLLQQAVARGLSIDKVAKDVGRLLLGDFPSLQDYGMRKFELADLRTVQSDALRIARSEVLNAGREANQQAMDASPIIVAAAWSLSGNHGVADECDDLATADEFGYGPGMWLINQWPVAPHPNCACYAGDVAFRDPSTWDQPKVYENAE